MWNQRQWRIALDQRRDCVQNFLGDADAVYRLGQQPIGIAVIERGVGDPDILQQMDEGRRRHSGSRI